MLPPPVNCVICGCPFRIASQNQYRDDDGWIFEVPTEDQTKQWLMNSRLIGATACLEEFASDLFEIPENHSTINGFFVSGPAEYIMPTGFSLNGIDFEAMTVSQNGKDTLFPLHEACLEIVQRAIRWHLESNPSSSLTLASIYHILCIQYLYDFKESNTTPSSLSLGALLHRCGLRFRHRYHGAGLHWGDCSLGWLQKKDNEWLCNDPMGSLEDVAPPVSQTIPKLRSSELKPAADHNRSGSNRSISNLEIALHSSFESLPLEILQLIIEFLPVQAILRLQRCSKTLKQRIVLSQAFWRAHLLTGNLAPYICHLSEMPEIATKDTFQLDWKSLAQNLTRRDRIFEKEIVYMAPASWGFWNRIRIGVLVNYLIQWAERGDVEPPAYPILSPVPRSFQIRFLSRIYNWFMV
ncbi:hypothetical protein BGZ63DRAFT_388240 [Mariannaea sp. PMI_226]|nr:hypothetical protein BGZ63DRAFT_388240 [Mariannaea sp. PMI_226]